MFDHSPSDRVQHRSLGSLQAPGCCALCGNGSNESGYVDFGLFIDYFGTVYLCVDPCALQAAELIGCLVPGEAEHLKLISEEVAQENKLLRDENAILSNRVSVIDSLIADAISSGVISVPTVEVESSESEHDPGTPKRASRRESAVTESVKSSGPNDAAQPTVRDKIDL